MSEHDSAAVTEKRDAGVAAVAVAGVLLALAGVATAVSSAFIARRFPDRPTPPDLLFETLPHWHVAAYTADAALYAAIAILLVVTVRRGPRKVASALCVFALMYLLRSVAMALTPLASAHGNGTLFGFVPLVQNGMWPSGHAAAALLCVLLIDTSSATIRRATGALAVIVWMSLLIGHAHYSIDVLGGMLLAYFVQREWEYGSSFGALKRWIDPDSTRPVRRESRLRPVAEDDAQSRSGERRPADAGHLR